MKDSIIEYKVKIFISSKCGGRYTVVRKALKMLLSESSIASVYIFETAGASSQDVVSSYINPLDDSDLCIFLIDNADGIPDPVLVEQKRARELGKKSIYLFCDEDRKEPTQLQKEIKKDLGERFVVVHEFSDFIEQGYQGVIQEIINIYRVYCRGKLINKTGNEETGSIDQIIDTYKLDKEIFKGFDLTKNEFFRLVYHHDNEVKETSELDNLSRQLLCRVIGKEIDRTIDFETLKKELCSTHKDFLRGFITSRINAISAYFNNDLERCLSELNSAYDAVKSNTQIPNWLLNDVLIDMRNIQRLLDETKSQITIENKAQKLLSENCESAYYPLLDRYVSNFSGDVLKECLSVNTDSPYTTNFGGLDTALRNIASAFVISVVYGSLTHILITRERLIECFSAFCFIYRDHTIYIELLKALLMCQKDKEIEKIIRAYNQTTDMLNDSDIDYFYKGINSIPITHKRLISKFILIKHFGYYYSDDKYLIIFNELIDEVDKWINNNERIFAIATFIFKALKSNIHRANKNRVIALLISIFEKGLRRWYDDALQVVEVIDFSLISEEMEEKLVNQIMSIVLDKKLRDNCKYISSTIIHIRKNVRIGADSIDDKIKEYMPSFYEGDYSLEVFGENKIDNLRHISRYVETIQQQNEEQGENGIYKGYMGDPYLTIRNIIEYDDLHLDWIEIEPIISAIDHTIFAPKQSFNAKVSAIQLMMYIRNKAWANDKLDIVFTKWLDKQSEVLCAYGDGLFEKDSISTLSFSFTMLKVCFSKYDIDEIVTAVADIAQKGDYEIIKSLQCIEAMIYNLDLNNMDANVLIMIVQYAISMSSYKEKDARYYSAKILLLLCRSNYKSLVLSQLSKMMDNDIYEIKACILSRISKIPCGDEEIIKYIKQKGKVDNHFLVRKIAYDTSSTTS